MNFDIAFLTILLVPLLIPWAMKYFLHSTITWKEMGIHILLVIVSVSTMYAISTYSMTSDYEVWNGQTTSKKKVRVSCRHSYSCNCRTTSCGKNCSTTTCDTCYDHSFDNDWNIYTTLGKYRIRTIDRQGLEQPPRWTSAKKGDPVAQKRPFPNYVKAVPDSLFHDDQTLKEKFVGLIPAYPDKIYDYHYINRVLNAGTNIPITNLLNKELALRLRTLGAAKKNNTIIVFAKTDDPNYRYALEAEWIGGKKNDAVVVIGVTDYPNISWVDVFGWSKNELFNVALRDEIRAMKTIDKTLIDIIERNVSEHFEKRSMEEFAYLKDEIEPPMWALMLIFGLNMCISGGLAYYMHKNDVFGDERRRRRW